MLPALLTCLENVISATRTCLWRQKNRKHELLSFYIGIVQLFVSFVELRILVWCIYSDVCVCNHFSQESIWNFRKSVGYSFLLGKRASALSMTHSFFVYEKVREHYLTSCEMIWKVFCFILSLVLGISVWVLFELAQYFITILYIYSGSLSFSHFGDLLCVHTTHSWVKNEHEHLKRVVIRCHSKCLSASPSFVQIFIRFILSVRVVFCSQLNSTVLWFAHILTFPFSWNAFRCLY